MDWNKYMQISSTNFATAKEIGLAPATLISMANKGLIEIKESVPKQYRRIKSNIAKIYYLCEKHKDKYEEYFTLYKNPHTIGMFCSVNNGTICDCWGKPINLTDYTIVSFRKHYFDINTGREI